MIAEGKTVCLTDAPGVVALKREFYALDLRAEELRCVPGSAAEREGISARKAAIAREIFKADPAEVAA